MHDESAAVLAEALYLRLCNKPPGNFTMFIDGPQDEAMKLADRMMAETGNFERDRRTYRLWWAQTKKLRDAVARDWNFTVRKDKDGSITDARGAQYMYDGVVKCYSCWVKGRLGPAARIKGRTGVATERQRPASALAISCPIESAASHAGLFGRGGRRGCMPPPPEDLHESIRDTGRGGLVVRYRCRVRRGVPDGSELAADRPAVRPHPPGRPGAVQLVRQRLHCQVVASAPGVHTDQPGRRKPVRSSAGQALRAADDAGERRAPPDSADRCARRRFELDLD